MKSLPTTINRFQLHAFATAAVLLTAGCAAQSAPLTFAQVPAGAGAREPAPNVIVSVDDSGSMKDAGIATLKDALNKTFNATNIPDNRIRLGWQSMNRCRGIPSTDAACNKLNGLKVLSGTHRTTFLNWVNGLTSSGPTPSHLMISNAGKYFQNTTLGINSPWASNPGVTEMPLLSCRKSFHVFMTDGGWNGTGLYADDTFKDASDTSNSRIFVGNNPDGTWLALPDGTPYLADTSQTRIYKDNWGSANLSTLSDLAFYYWATDLQTGLTNDVRPSTKKVGSENFGTAAKPATLTQYWNPRNNPATWQNMVNYTIGFDPDGTGPTDGAAEWTGAPVWGTNTFSGDLNKLILGEVKWPTPYCGANNTGTGNLPCDKGIGYNTGTQEPVLSARKMELWHAALNSRGQFVPAPNGQALVDAFKVILDDILAQTTKPLVSIATSASRLTTGAFAYIAKYNSESWSGDLSAYPLNDKTGLPSLTASWTASTEMDKSGFNPATRVVLTHNGSVGKAFKWASLTADQKSSLRSGTTDTDAVGQTRLNFIRGDRSKEERETGGNLRNRTSRLGDIVNSNMWYTGKPLRMDTEYVGHKSFRSSNASRTPMLYVGANDGMLHGFNATTGTELLAYVPLGAYSNLRSYTMPSYDHRYFVDGHPFTGDAYTGSSWKTFLVGTMGAGGKGYFILDVSNPSNFTDPGTGDSSVVVIDNTATANADIGYIFAAPTLDNGTQSISQQIVKLNNGRWAAILGNGYNSSNERPALLIQYLDGSKELKTIVADSATGQANGLGAPRTVDVDGNGTMDVVYAGDLKGNLWKFNLISTSDSSWGVSGWSNDSVCSSSCVPLFVAKTAGNETQAITTAPIALNHPYGGKQIMFGTGRDLIEADRNAAPKVETIYSVWDKTKYLLTAGVLSSVGTGASITNGRTALVQQAVTGTDSSGRVSTSTNAVAYSITDASAKRGWYFDLPVTGERVLSNPLYMGESTVLVGSVVPKKLIIGETCDLSSSSDRGYITALNAVSGKGGSTPLFGTLAPATATRTEFGTGEFASLTDFKSGRQTAISTNANCTGSDCGNEPQATPAIDLGGECVVGTGCTGPTCTPGVNCPDTTCSGPSCICNGTICQCVGPDCGTTSVCTGPRCRSQNCGTLIPGAIADLCIPGLFGARTDWRELR